jgi:hypothetical protein
MRHRLALVIAVVLLAAGCGPTEDGAPGGGGNGGGSGIDQGAGGGAALTVSFDVEGEITLKGTTTDTVLPSPNGRSVDTCADYAKGGQRSNGKAYFILPLRLGGDLDGKRVALQVMVRDYTGPGNYTQEKLTAEGVSFGVAVDDKPYVAQGDGNGSIVSTDANGGGTFYFEKLAYSTGGDVSPGISGQISWTCKD